jgi:chaperonin GroEL
LTKKYDFGTSLNQKILEGVNVLADNVASTLGPKGRNVILQEKGKRPIITKDGVTVAQFVTLQDPMQNAGAQIIKQAASQTNNVAGDGTTTATVLARAILNQAQAYLTSGASPVELKRGMDRATEAITDRLLALAKPISSVEDIEHIATISANGDKDIGKLVATAVDTVGKDGAISIEEARSADTTLDVLEGFQFDSGYASPSFITDERRGIVNHERAYILVADGTVATIEEMLPVLEVVARESRPLIIISENIEGQALAALIMNSMRGTLKVAAIKAPRYGEERRNILKDLSLAVGASIITPAASLKLKDVKIEHLGQCRSIEIEKNRTVIVGGLGDYEKVEKRIEQLKIELAQTESLYECERIQERITRLASGVAVIHVGAPTEIEMIEKKHRIEDALEAVKAAQQEGIVPGGGTALIRAVQDLEIDTENEQQAMGVAIVKKAVYEPLRQMATNAGASADLIQRAVLDMKDFEGYNFSDGEVVNMIEAGIIDPVKVTRSALQNAVSAAGTLMTTNYAIIQVE